MNRKSKHPALYILVVLGITSVDRSQTTDANVRQKKGLALEQSNILDEWRALQLENITYWNQPRNFYR
jgi:hypothetical protein